MSKVTIKDLARDSGVSVATVSRVLNQNGYVSKDSEQKVRDSIQRLGYNKSQYVEQEDLKVIAVLLPWFSMNVHSTVIEGIQDVAEAAGYSMIAMQTTQNRRTNNLLPSLLSRDLVKGVVAFLFPQYIENFSNSFRPGLPLVQCGEYSDDLNYPYVSVDNYQAAYNAVSYLHSTGRRKIALLNYSLDATFSAKRETGYFAALQDLGLPVRPEWIYNLKLSTFNYNQAFSAAQDILSQEDRPDAIFATSDTCAMAVLRAANKLGISVPKELSIIGFDNSDNSIISDPPLTTIRQPYYEMGRTACSTLIALIEGHENHIPRIFMDTELVVRGTT